MAAGPAVGGADAAGTMSSPDARAASSPCFCGRHVASTRTFEPQIGHAGVPCESSRSSRPPDHEHSGQRTISVVAILIPPTTIVIIDHHIAAPVPPRPGHPGVALSGGSPPRLGRQGYGHSGRPCQAEAGETNDTGVRRGAAMCRVRPPDLAAGDGDAVDVGGGAVCVLRAARLSGVPANDGNESAPALMTAVRRRPD